MIDQLKKDAEPFQELNLKTQSWKDILKFLWNYNEFPYLQKSNPDGYFYLLFLKKSAHLFGIGKD